MTKTRWIGLGIGIMLIVAAFGLVVWQAGSLANNSGAALAQGAATPTPAQTTAPSTKPGTSFNFLSAFWDALASRLGISADTLKSDVVAAEKDVINQAVKAGQLTQDQANRLEQHLNSNQPFVPFGYGRMPGLSGPGSGRNFNPGFKGAFLGRTDVLEAVAKSLNLQPSELVAQVRSGKTLAAIAQAQNVDQSVVKQAIITAVTADVNRAVQDGVLSQTMANSLLANLTPDKIDLTRMSGGWGMGLGRY